MKGTPKCFAANRLTGSRRHVDDRTTLAPVRSSIFLRRASNLGSIMYGKFRGLGVLSQLSRQIFSEQPAQIISHAGHL
jgi:hypothetical protein